MINPSPSKHDKLDREEGKLLAGLHLARYATPATYAATRITVARELAEIDRRRTLLLQGAK